MARRVKPEARFVADLLHSSAIHLLRRAAAADAQSGVSRAALSALSVVVFRGPLTVGELAAAEGVRSPSMTRTVQTLERAGLVARRPHESDGRATLVAATAKGARALHRARRRRIDRLAAVLAELGGDELDGVRQAAETVEQLFGSPERPWRPLDG